MFPKQDSVVKLDEGEIVLFPSAWTHPYYRLGPIGHIASMTVETCLC